MNITTNHFPQNRFAKKDLIYLVHTSEWVEDGNEINIELNLASHILTLCFMSSLLNNDKIPNSLLEILFQFNDIDNIVQLACEKNAACSPSAATNYQYQPAVIYLQENGIPFIDYWGLRVNNQWSVFLAKHNGRWLPFKDEARKSQL